MVNGDEIIKNKIDCHLDVFMMCRHLNHKTVKIIVATNDRKNADKIFP
jgi:hypothetical protein